MPKLEWYNVGHTIYVAKDAAGFVWGSLRTDDAEKWIATAGSPRCDQDPLSYAEAKKAVQLLADLEERAERAGGFADEMERYGDAA